MTKRSQSSLRAKKAAAPAKTGADKDTPDIAQLSIQSRPVFVGDCLLSLREPGYCTLIEISKTLLSDNLAENVKKLTGIAKGAFDGVEVTAPIDADTDADTDATPPTMRQMSKGELVARYLDTIVDVVREGVMPLLGRQLREIAVILLDTQKNRDLVGEHLTSGMDAAERAEVVNTDGEYFSVVVDEDEVDTSPEFRSWVRRSITAHQFDHVIERFQSLRGWLDVGKRIASRFGLGELALRMVDDSIVPTGSPATPN